MGLAPFSRVATAAFGMRGLNTRVDLSGEGGRREGVLKQINSCRNILESLNRPHLELKRL